MTEIYSTFIHHPSMLALVTGLFIISFMYLANSKTDSARIFFSIHCIGLIFTFAAYYFPPLQIISLLYIVFICAWVLLILTFPKINLGIKLTSTKKLNQQAFAIAVISLMVTGIWQKL